MINRVEKFRLNAKRAFEYAAGEREEIKGKNKTIKTIRYSRTLKNELNEEEQKVFQNNPEYAYKYSVVLSKKRLCSQVENKFLEDANTNQEIKYAIKYCNFFNIALPICLHNKILLQAAMPADSQGLTYYQKVQKRIAEKARKKYLIKFQQQKKDFLIFLDGLVKNNNLNENSTIKDIITLLD